MCVKDVAKTEFFGFQTLKFRAMSVRIEIVGNKGRMNPPKRMFFSEKFQKGGGVISNPKIYIADFCHYKRFFGHVFLKKTAI